MTSFLAKANPNKYDLDCFLDGSDKETLWTVCKDAKPDDVLYLAKCGKEAGIVAMARITENPSPQKDDVSDPCWTAVGRASSLARDVRLRAKIEILCKVNIPESELASYPILDKKLTWLHGQGTCCHLREEEEDTIQALIREWGYKKK